MPKPPDFDTALADALRTYELSPHSPYERDVAAGIAQRLVAKRLGAFPGDAAPSKFGHMSRGRTSTGSFGSRIGTFKSRAFAFGAVTTIVVGGMVAVLHYAHLMMPVIPPTVRTYRTSAGQQARVTLASDVQVTLGPATTLAVSTRPSEVGVTVAVRGQALFTVAHQHQTPLIVRTKNAVTQVLGTQFLVRQYDDDRDTRVVVTEGRVSLRSAHRAVSQHGVTLSVGALGTVNDSGTVRVVPNIAVEDYTAWTSGQLVFHETPVREIVAELGRTYGADIRLADAGLAARVLTWTIPVRTSSLAEALEALTTVLDAHVTQSRAVLTIVPGALASRPPLRSHLPYSSEQSRGK